MSQKDVFIVAAKRTPVGAFNGSLSSLQGHELGAIAIKAAVEEAGLAPTDINESIMGQVLTAGVGMNPARQASRGAGLPNESPALNINQVCGSGLRAVSLGSQQILTGDADIVVAGGQECMSQAPHVSVLRQGKKLGDINLIDTMMCDGLTDVFYGYHMGVTAENIVREYKLTREGQDQFALTSQQRASAASRAGRFVDEITPVTISTRKGDIVVSEDEYIRHDATAESMAKLRPAFEKEGTVTAANASGINDGAAALVLMSGAAMAEKGVQPMARIASSAHTGLDPQVMGLGPISASRKALEKAGWDVDSVDLWELNEAFAAQSMAVVEDLKIDMDKGNVNGGAIAIGHPIGASGARILTTLVHEMIKRDARRGVAALCIGGGMGVAMCIERA
ncbi:MAG: acetyl-CoA C-acetyltransferase [Gammaproteobacteria bacterium]|nr:acetyl-CoA C-acetyltransferase [Gammaproteobacteria bacterium]